MPLSRPQQKETEFDEARSVPLGRQVKALLVWPPFPPSFWSFQGMLELLPEKTVMPPLGLLTIAALCPPNWSLRLVDCSCMDLRQDDLEWADLVMLSAMHAQRFEAKRIARWASSLGRRTIIGGPYASSQPEEVLKFMDHVVVGEPDEVFAEIARDLEQGTAKRLYEVVEKPDISATPVPRFDLLEIGRYAAMAVQFSRGCPFKCEFCDIITIYGRKPRTKSPAQLLCELDALHALGWRQQVFIVDDNFIGNHKRALQMVKEIESWQKARGYPLAFYTEASLDLAQRTELIDRMVRANFLFVFIGIESPEEASLREAKKFQNLRRDTLACVRSLQRRGLWVMGGFIIGFDSDPPDICARQRVFIERSGIPWAMAGFLQALPTTPLFDRVVNEGRLFFDSQATTNFSPPNFRTVLPRATLLREFCALLTELYDPEIFYERAFRSLLHWKVKSHQRPPKHPLTYRVRVALRSVLVQGLMSSYRRAYWSYLVRLVALWRSDPVKLWWGFTILCSGHHFLRYAREVAQELEIEASRIERLEERRQVTATPSRSSLPLAPKGAASAAAQGKALGSRR